MFKENHRKHFLINRPLQSRYMLSILGTLTLVSVASALCLYFGIWNMVLKEFSNDQIQSRLELTSRLHDYETARAGTQEPTEFRLALIKEVELFAVREREVLDEIIKNTYKQLSPMLLALFFFIGWGTIFISHRVAGPLYRIEKSLSRLVKGELNFRVHFRKYDEGKALVPVFNQFLENLEGSVCKLKESSRNLNAKMKEGSYPVECLELLAEINHELAKYQTSKS